jgi:hypothetical protein
MQLADEFGKQKGKLCLEIYVDVWEVDEIKLAQAWFCRGLFLTQ